MREKRTNWKNECYLRKRVSQKQNEMANTQRQEDNISEKHETSECLCFIK